MNRPVRWCWPMALTAAVVVCSPLFAQQAPPAATPPTATAPAAAPPATAPPAATAPAAVRSPYRNLAPGVVQSVDLERELDESFSRHDVVELLAFDPKFDWAKDVSFRHDVWALQFQFKPVRMLWVDVPQESGQMRQKLIWYMVYSVTNTGKVLHPLQDSDKPYEEQYVDSPIRFIPQFLLEGRESLDPKQGVARVYPDRVIPIAIDPIRLREDPRRKFFNSAEISLGRLAVGKTAWGVATWEDVDPKTDRFSVYVQGLTNAYKWTDEPAKYAQGAPLTTYRSFLQKTLKLNFWRPSDEYLEHEGEIRYGVPGEVDYEWVYR